MLELDAQERVGLRQQQLLEADESGELATASAHAHAAWQERRADALIAGAEPSARAVR